MVSTFPHTEFRIGLQRLSVTSCHEMSFVININSTEATTPTSKHRHLGKCNYVLRFNCVLSSFIFFFYHFTIIYFLTIIRYPAMYLRFVPTYLAPKTHSVIIIELLTTKCTKYIVIVESDIILKKLANRMIKTNFIY